METETVPEEIVQVETVIVDTAAEAEMTTMAAGSDTTKVIHMMIHAANEGISLQTTALACWVGPSSLSRLLLSTFQGKRNTQNLPFQRLSPSNPGKDFLSGRYTSLLRHLPPLLWTILPGIIDSSLCPV